MAFQQKSISTGVKQYPLCSRICSPIVWRKKLYRRTSGMHAVIVSLYKNKGEKSDCSNYIGIPLLSVAGRILARFLLNRLIPTIAQKNTQKSQRGFRSKRGMADMIFMLRQIQEKCREQNMGLYLQLL